VPKPITKGGVRVLRPAEYEQLRQGAETLENQTRSDAPLLTGLRYVEAQRLQGNPDWVDGRFIHLPVYAQRKVKRKQKERWVKLSSKGASILPYFFKAKPLPNWKGWTQNLERWAGRAGLDPEGLGPKTTRKTWESWLVASYPERVLEIFLSKGHTQTTSLNHLPQPPLHSSRQRGHEGMGKWMDLAAKSAERSRVRIPSGPLILWFESLSKRTLYLRRRWLVGRRSTQTSTPWRRRRASGAVSRA